MPGQLIAIQVDPVELLLHNGAKHASTHLPKDQPDFIAMVPRPAAVPTVQIPEESLPLLEMFRDFWLALIQAKQDPLLQNEMQKMLAQVLQNVGQMYVPSSAGSMQTAVIIDANAHRFLLQKLKAEPLVKADKVMLAAIEKLEEFQKTGRKPTAVELVQIYTVLGNGIVLTPEILKAILQQMIEQMRNSPRQPQYTKELQNLMQGGAKPSEIVRVLSQQPPVKVQKPDETHAFLELFCNFWLAMHQTRQNVALRDQMQREMAETLRNFGALYGPKTSPTPPAVDQSAYRVMLMHLRSDPAVKGDNAKMQAVEQCIAASASGRAPTPQQQLQVMTQLSKCVQMTPEMLRVVLEHMVNVMRALTSAEKIEMQKRVGTKCSAWDVLHKVHESRMETKHVQQEAEIVGCFQVFPQGHPGVGSVQPPSFLRSRELGMRAGPASVEWHRYVPLGLQPPATEMARILVVQSQLGDVEKFQDDKTLRSLRQEATDVSFRSILQPTVLEKYETSLKRDNPAAASALQNMSKMGGASDEQFGKGVDKLLNTMNIDRPQLKSVLQQMVNDRLMTNVEAQEIERRVEPMMAGEGGMKLSELQAMLRVKK